jgi:hypothetical protein
MAGHGGQDETLNRFVLRARRIAAHSLTQDPVALRRHAEGLFNGTLDMSGNMTITQDLPENEEAFESLAARLRPLIVSSESIYYEKVLSALQQSASDEDQESIEQLRAAWSAANIQGSEVQAFLLQQSNLDGSGATGFVSDTQLAAAWLYADLVHADATGRKKEGLDFVLAERYAAAVRVFSHLATLTLATLALVRTMVDAGRLTIASEALTDEVVVGKKQLVREARAYVAEVGTAPPDLRVAPGWSEEWRQFTVTELRRQDPANRVRVILRAEDGVELVSYDSAVIRRDMSVEPGEWHVLVGGCFVFKFGIERTDGSVVGGRLDGMNEVTGTNELGLAAARLRLQMHAAASVVFSVNDVELFELRGFGLSPEDLRQDEVLAEALGDIVVVERLTGKQISLCGAGFTNGQRVLLRRARLLHEGNLVRSARGPLRATIAGERPPQVICTSPSTLDIGGAIVPVLASSLCHPSMSAEVIEKVGGETAYSMVVPAGERFLEWAPEKRDLRPDSDFSATAPYGLTGIDEDCIG